MKITKKSKSAAVLTAVLILIMTIISASISSCGNGGTKTIGVSMPMTDATRWTQDGQNIKQQFENKGYKVMLEYAESDSAKQISQIQSMIDAKCKAIIIAATDCFALDEVLSKAAKSGIKIIAYDRLIMDTNYVDYYCTFDNFEAGESQGNFLVDKFNLSQSGDPVTLEIFSGAADDSTSIENYNGQMSVLKPYIDSGRIIVKSGETDDQITAIKDWSGANAEARMTRLLGDYYQDSPIDAVLSTNDSMALGVISALKSAGYGIKNENGNGDKPFPFPIITGMDCDAENVKAIINGYQAMSLFIDTRALAKRVVELTDDILLGKTPENLETARFNNNNKIVPTLICKSIYVDVDNYSDVLVKRGYYSEEDFK